MAQILIDAGVQLLVLQLCQRQSCKGYTLNQPAVTLLCQCLYFVLHLPQLGSNTVLCRNIRQWCCLGLGQ